MKAPQQRVCDWGFGGSAAVLLNIYYWLDGMDARCDGFVDGLPDLSCNVSPGVRALRKYDRLDRGNVVFFDVSTVILRTFSEMEIFFMELKNDFFLAFNCT